jgi:hypothetical protein
VRTAFGHDGGVRMRFDAARPALMRPSSVPGVQPPREQRGAVDRRTVSPPVLPPARRRIGRATLVPDVKTMTVVPGGLDQHTAQVRATVLVIAPMRRSLPLERSEGTRRV